MEESVARFAGMTDPRQGYARPDLHQILMIAHSALLCGGEDCSDMARFGEAKEPFLRAPDGTTHSKQNRSPHSAWAKCDSPGGKRLTCCLRPPKHVESGSEQLWPGRTACRIPPLHRPAAREFVSVRLP